MEIRKISECKKDTVGQKIEGSTYRKRTEKGVGMYVIIENNGRGGRRTSRTVHCREKDLPRG
jgi:hypothetical protein